MSWANCFDFGCWVLASTPPVQCGGSGKHFSLRGRTISCRSPKYGVTGEMLEIVIPPPNVEEVARNFLYKANIEFSVDLRGMHLLEEM